ncbi:MAG TPA: helix-turn-helix transcriptional regulator [Pyrinomonadaceae bacterium]|jgi:transcriptional regulator with XRE-family HTH domain
MKTLNTIVCTASGIQMRQRNLKRRYKRFQELLVEARKNAGLSQEAVAERIGQPQSVVSKIESGVRRLDVVEFMAVMEAIDMDPVDFIKKLK